MRKNTLLDSSFSYNVEIYVLPEKFHEISYYCLYIFTGAGENPIAIPILSITTIVDQQSTDTAEHGDVIDRFSASSLSLFLYAGFEILPLFERRQEGTVVGEGIIERDLVIFT